jgi:hypothetical protein
MRHSTIATAVLALLLAVVSLARTGGQVASLEHAAHVTVQVAATHPWVDSGVTVRKGDRLLFAATGTIQWGAESDQSAGPEGHGAKAGKLGAGGLIGRVGHNGKPFPIGNVRTPIIMPASGKLFLGINDFVFADNVGAFTVTISPSGTS